MSGSALVLRGDARRLPLPDASIDLVITSPPFLNLRSYRDNGVHYEGQVGTGTQEQFLEDLWEIMLEVKRVMKPTASAFIELGDSYENKCLNLSPHRFAIGCTDKLGFMLRAEIIWDRPNGLPESVTDRVRRSHSCWFHFVKSSKYFAAVDEVREPHLVGQATGAAQRITEEGSPYRGATVMGPNGHNLGLNPLGKLPGSVWQIPSEPLLVPQWAKDKYNLPDHFAAFPQEWPRRLILGWSPNGVCEACGEGRRPVVDRSIDFVQASFHSRRRHEIESGPESLTHIPGRSTNIITGYACACEAMGDGYPGTIYVLPPTKPAIVLDPFGGTGTVAMVARALGRDAISLDLSMDYSRLAQWRIHSSGHGAKALGRTWRERQGTL